MSDAYGPSSGTMLRRALLLTIGCGAAAYSFPRYFTDGGGSVGNIDNASMPATPHPPARHPNAVPEAEPPATETFHAQRGNQFYVTGSVNGNLVHFIVDSGATVVALTLDDARLIGFDLAALKWTIGMRTANGNTTAAPVTLGDIRLGRIVEYNVPALVMRQGGISLLGMSFLSRLRSWQISQGVLTISS